MFNLIKKTQSYWEELFRFPEIKYPVDSDKGYEREEESGEDENGSWKVEKWKSIDGTSSFYRKFYQTKEKIKTREDLEKEMNLAASEQRFEDAAKLQKELKGLS